MSCKQTERSFLPFPWQRLPSKNSLGYREICGAQWNNKAMDPSMLGVTFLMEVQKAAWITLEMTVGARGDGKPLSEPPAGVCAGH